MSDSPTGALVVIPSRLRVGEEFSLKVKLTGEVHPVPCENSWCARTPGLRGQFNLAVSRGIQFHDNALPEFVGTLDVDGGDALDGPREIVFDGGHQGAYPCDVRPIGVFGGFRFTRPGIHFITIGDPGSGIEVSSNAAVVTEDEPALRLYWGDPHWQTFFSDGIRCPEELYAFARDEGFLDFGAVTDHMESVTDRQWDYFQAVTNDHNEPGRFVTLQGQEWTNHDPAVGAPGHRNVYYRGDGGPVLRSNDPDCNTLGKLWRRLDAMAGIEAIAVPHHSANTVMGVDWSQGWNPRYEKAVEVHSVWGCSERHAEDGNPMPIGNTNLGGEMRGRHVVDALKMGCRFGFVGGGDIHDGRPGDDLHDESYPPKNFRSSPEGFTGAWLPALTREALFDAIGSGATYATTRSRIYLDAALHEDELDVTAASEDGIASAELVRNGATVDTLRPDADERILTASRRTERLAPDEFLYVRLTTRAGRLAWSSPFFGIAQE